MKIYSLLMREIESFLVNKQQIINFMLVNDKERSLKGRQTKTRAEDTKQTVHFSRRSVCEERGGEEVCGLPCQTQAAVCCQQMFVCVY